MGHKRSFSASPQGTQDGGTLSDDDANADLSIAIVAKASNRPPPGSYVGSITIDSDSEDHVDAHPSSQPSAINDPPGPSSVSQETEKPQALDEYVHSYIEKLKELDERRESPEIKKLKELDELRKAAKIERLKELEELRRSLKRMKKRNRKHPDVNGNQPHHSAPNRNQSHHSAPNGIKQDSAYTIIEDDGDNNLEMRKLLRGPRYFDEPQLDADCCYRCGNPGHIALNCTEEARKRTCYVCGSDDHAARDCPKGPCFICRHFGHSPKSCPNKYNQVFNRRDKWKACLRCGDLGHEMSQCDKDYDPEDLEAIQCYVCRKKGHLCCINVKFSFSQGKSCYNCGRIGHTGMECASDPTEVNEKRCYTCNQTGHEARHCTRVSKDEMGYNPQTPHLTKRKADHEFEGVRSAPSRIGQHTRWNGTPPRWCPPDESDSDGASKSKKKKKKSAHNHENFYDDRSPERRQNRHKRWGNH